MALTLQNVFGTVPEGTEFPGTVQGLGDLIAQYMAITGGETFISINFGPNEPGVDDRDAPWFKTDVNGNPLGWYSWNGSDWVIMPVVIPSGNTASRPSDAVVGQLYEDTEIGVLLKYSSISSSWVTAAGSPGDMKFVQALTIEAALLKNPGWEQADEATMSGRVLGAAGSGTSLTPRAYAESTGDETITLSITQIPEHTHTVAGVTNTRMQADGNASAPAGILAAYGSENTGSTPEVGTGGLAHANMQPTFFAWLLVYVG